ncbi:glucosamine-6-phosphate deaminase [Mariniluteicoccus endophyticus]
MEIITRADAESVGAYAASIIADVVTRADGRATLGLATGSSPLPTYAALAALVRAGDLDLARCQAFALDEYVGLPAGHPQSYREVIRRTVVEPLGMDPDLVHVPDGAAANPAAAAAAYDRTIAEAGGIDVQILGIGSNGHIAFNEPTSSMTSRTRVKTLTARTRRDNARYFDSPDDVPVHCITQGLGTIGESRRALLVATGANKATAVAAMIEGPLSAMCPASVLQLHPHATVVIDDEAAGQLAGIEHYRDIQLRRPEWQPR